MLTLAFGLSAVAGPPAYAAVARDLKCKDAKAKAAGIRAFSLLKAFGKNTKKPNAAKLAQAVSKVQSKFDKGFAAAEQKGGCQTTGDAGAIGAETDEYVASVFTQLCPTASTTTTLTSASTTTTTTTLPSASNGMVISEVLYDPSGSDDGAEWVELKNTSSTAIDLSTFSLGYGGNDYTFGTVQLSGTIPAGGIFVVGGPTSDASNGNPLYDLLVDFTPDLQNSGTIGDGMALFDAPATDVTVDTVPIDAVVYGPNNDNALLDESGLPNPPEVDDAPGGSSIERVDSAGNWQIQSVPTPTATPF
jgi:hypothetical protein